MRRFLKNRVNGNGPQPFNLENLKPSGVRASFKMGRDNRHVSSSLNFQHDAVSGLGKLVNGKIPRGVGTAGTMKGPNCFGAPA